MKKLFTFKHFFVSLLVLILFEPGTSRAQSSNFSYGFEAAPGANDWSANIGVASGTNGILAASGGFYGLVPSPASPSQFTRFGGYNDIWPCNGYKTSIKMYLDLSAGYANDTRLNYSSAISNQSGAHLRDFIYHVGFYNGIDVTGPGAGTDRFVVGASNNSPGNPKGNPDAFAISTSGWFRFEHSFYESGGALAVDFKVYDAANTQVGSTITRSTPADLIATIVGGNRYGWMVTNDFSPFAIDDVTLTVNPVTGPVHNIITGFNYCSIQAAIDDPLTLNGHTITVDAGTYTENINIYKGVTINGPNVGTSGSGVRVPEAILLNCGIDINNAFSTTLDGLHIKRTDATSSINQIELDGGIASTVQNCVFERIDPTPILVPLSSSVNGAVIRAIATTTAGGTKNILNNKITGDLAGGLFSKHRTWNNGIYVDAGLYTVNVIGNTIMNCRSALNIDDYKNTLSISGNTFDNNGSHISLGGSIPTTGSFVMGANDFINNPSSTMVNCSNVNTNFRLDITSSTLNGVAFNALTNAQLFDVEARMAHKTTGSKKGKITYVANTQYVNNIIVPFPFTKIDIIQNSILYAEVGNIINLQAGTYAQRVVIDKSVTLQGVESTKTLYILDGTGLAPNGAGPGSQSGIVINSGITNTTIKDLTVQNFTGVSGNNDGAIYGILGNNNLAITNVALLNNPTASGFYANGPVDNVAMTNSMVTNNGSGARGMVIWNGLKTNINFSNNMLTNNSCCGIELSDGNASGVTVTGNTIDIGGGDNAIGLVGLNNSVGANTINNNIITGGGRYGIEIKNPAGGVTVNANSVTLTTLNADVRDRAGIAIFRRGVTSGNVDIPTGVTITGNTVTGYQQASTSEGFGIVVEGTNHTVTGNTVSGCEVGILQQQNSSNYPGDADQSNLADLYFGRGNSPMTCGNTISGNTLSNTLDTRNIGVGGGIVTNTTSLETFCSISAAINDAETLNGHTLVVDAGTYNENVVVNKSLTLRGPNNLISPNGGARVPEAIITGGLSVDNSASRTIIIEGFHFQGVTSPMVYNGNAAGTIAADFTFRKNLVNNLSGQLAVDLGTATNSAMVVLDDNSFVSMSGNAVQLNGGTGTLNATVTNNSITGTVTAGINTNSISTSTFFGNAISNTGQQGIQVAGTASNVTISNNVITNANTSNAADRGGIRLRGGTLTGFVNITNNIISGSNNGIALPAPDDITGKSINVNNNDLSGNTKSINHFGTGNLSATCNWYGSTVPATIAAIISGPVNYIPWLTSGVDLGGNSNDGFQPSVLCVACNVVLTATPAQIPCFGGTSSVSLSATGGTGVYTFGGDATTNLTAGTYNYTVTDANGCSAIQSATIDAAPDILSATVTATQPTCNGTNDGIIAINSSAGGSGLFEYSIDGGSTWTATTNNTGLEPGTYNVQIRDENQIACVIDLGNQIITYPAVLSATVASTNGTCIAADNGTITVSDPLGGGSGTYEFRLDGGAWQTSGSFTPLANGTYSVQMRDAVNTACELTLGNKTITNNGVPPTVTIAQSNPSAFCQGGAIILTANASAGVTYLWSPGGATTQSINVYSSGTYSVTVTKTNGCTASANLVVNYVASNQLSNYTILVKEQVWIEKKSYVQSGGVGNTYTGAISSNKIWVNDASTITGVGTFARAKFIDVEAGSTVSNAIPTASPVAFPAFVSNPTPSSGSNISVADNATVILNGTLYKDITVGKNATLTFTAAFVNIRKLTTKDKSKVTFTGSSELRINDRIDISTKNQFNPTMQTVIVYANSDVDIDKGTTFNGSIYSLKTIDPKGGNKSDERITMNGLFLAKEMHAHYATFNSLSCSGPSLVASFANVKEEELTTEVTAETIDEATPEFKVNVYPNPSSTDFTIQVISKSNEPVTVRLMDTNGVIRSISEVPLKASNVKVGSTLWPGTYFAEVVQGLNKKVIKLIKIN